MAPGAPRLGQSEGRALQQARLRDLPHAAARHQGDHAEVCGRSL